MRRIATSLLLACVLVAPGAAFDREALPTPYVSVGDGGSFYFKMIPTKDTVGAGVVYKVTSASTDEPTWSVSGWYSRRTFLSDDGRYLVRMGNWPRGHDPSPEHLAIAFYDTGVLIAQYSTKELIKNEEAVPRSVSHYEYFRYDAPHGFVRTPTDGVYPLHWFQFVTSDGIQYTFDRRTGAIMKSEPYSE